MTFDWRHEEVETRGFGGFLTVAALGLVAAALAKELLRPPNERTWHGKVVGVVPYDFRLPTWKRVKATFWNPDDAQIVKDKTFGVGWDVNFGAVARKVGLLERS